MKLRATKIVATMGPATSDSDSLTSILTAGANGSGVDVIRMNFSHGDFEFHGANINTVRAISQKLDKHIAIIADLPGPKIRIRSFKNDKIPLSQGQKFTIDVLKEDLGDETCVGVDYKEIINDCKVGDYLLLDDGNVELEITEIAHPKIVTKVISGNGLSNKKGINLKGGGLNAKAITARDEAIIRFATEQKVDFIAVSFVRRGSEMKHVHDLAKQVGNGHIPRLISKIERADLFPKEGHLLEGVLDEIILASDGVMVARGDLAIEVGVGALLGLQKFIIDRTIRLNRFVITATQMMESMITNPAPTRAEVSDVGNAVLDCTDAVMLSAESAVGKYPAKTVENMDLIARGIEDTRYIKLRRHYHSFNETYDSANQTIAANAVHISNHLQNVGAIISLTLSGSTALWLSRQVTAAPIFGVTNNPVSARFMNILTNVHPYLLEDDDLINNFQRKHFKPLLESLIKKGILRQDQQIIVTRASSITHPFQTNTLSIHSVEDVLIKSTF